MSRLSLVCGRLPVCKAANSPEPAYHKLNQLIQTGKSEIQKLRLRTTGGGAGDYLAAVCLCQHTADQDERSPD